MVVQGAASGSGGERFTCAQAAAANFPERPPRENYRQIGRGNGGVVRPRRPRFRSRSGTPTPCSIPTKFETVLYRDNGEAAGFGVRTPRFVAPRAAPAADSSAASASTPAGGPPDADSVGNRGNNSFASRVPRLQYCREGAPGPGKYNVASSKSRRRRQAPSAAFVMPTGVNLARLVEPIPPGPTDYASSDPNKPVLKERGAVSSTSAVIPRAHEDVEHNRTLWAVADANCPGPGDYEVLQSSQQRHFSPRLSRWKRRPASTEATQFAIGQRFLDGDTGEKPQAPGPTDYEPSGGQSFGKHGSYGAQGTSSFQVGNSHLPRSYKPTAPGPGDYEISKALDLCSAGVPTAVLGGVVPRFSSEVAAAPGPAYYSPSPPQGAQSFLLNIQKNWVS
eukprot:TRINITY_DN14862_c0_g2_i1.p1 TRINITY_DN14862_c0_g2~~TRINITY_DN14862_c0_g2_i1.p1  ORF type:complete len:405 (-),score=16.88 TRINITY_DN14862_c0_g2_i1:135-1310(-)